MSKTKKKSIFLIIAVVLFALIGGISQAVYSTDDSKAIISFNNNEWKCKEQFNDNWYVNTSRNDDGTAKEITFKINLKDYFKPGQNLDVPFSVSLKKEDDSEYASNVTVKKVENEPESYNVTFSACEVLNDNEKIIVEIDFAEGNSWDINKHSLKFYLISDNTNPVLNVANLKSIESQGEFKDPVSLICDVKEENLSEVNVQINKIKCQDAEVESITRTIKWNDKDSTPRDFISFNSENQFAVNFNDDGYYEVKISMLDNAGNVNENSDYVIRFQKNKFEYNINVEGAQSINKDNNTNNNYLIAKNRKLRFTFTNWWDILFDSIPYTLTKEGSGVVTEGNIKGKTEEITFPSDGTYLLNIHVVKWGVINPSSNETKDVNYTITIDNELPQLSTKVDGSDFTLDNNGEYYFKDPKNIKMKVTDSNLVSSSIKVFKDGTLISESQDSLDLNADKEGLYEIHMEAKDIADNSICGTYKFHIDNNPPEIKIEGVEDKDKIKKGDNDSPKVKVYVVDDTLEKAEAVITKTFKDKSEETYSVDLSNGQIHEFEADKNGTYSISVTANDKAGNIADEKKISFERDANPPELSIKANGDEVHFWEYNQDNVKYIKNDHGLKIDASVKEDYPKLNEDKSIDEKASYIKVKRTPVDQYGNEGQVEEGSEEYFTTEKSITLDKDGKYEVKIYSEDNCGNESSRDLFFILDGTTPDLSITGKKDYFSNNSEVKIESNDAFQVGGLIEIRYEKVIRNLDGNDQPLGENKITIDIDSAYKVVYLSDLPEFNDEAEYKISVIKAMDKAGNECSEENIHYIVDKNPPSKYIWGLEDDKLYYDSDRTITIETADVNLDKDSVKVTIFKDGEVYEPSEDEIVEELVVEDRKAHGVYKFTTDGEYKVVLESQDMAGNGENEPEEKEFIIDKTFPVISIDDSDTLNGSYINYDKNLTVRINEKNLKDDEESTNVYIIKKYPDGTIDPKPYAFNLNGECPNYSNVYSLFTEDAEYTVIVKATDKAGNSITSDPLVFTVDKTVPVQSITGVDNDAYYNVDKDVQFLSIDNNQDINTVEVTRDGEPYSVGKFTVEGMKAFLNETFSSEGTYDITFTTIDKANNKSISKVKFTIDKTAPDIKAIKSYDGSEIKFGEYMNKIFTPQFVLDKSEDYITQVTLNGADVTGNVSMASQEMEYNYSVTAQDRAGNVTTIDTLFTVDTTNPAISVSGIMSGFFNEDLTPEFDITDLNLDYANTSSTLNGEAFTSGTKIDGQNDFNLKLIGTDLATNSNSQSISFTIDKDGPVISFKNPISGKYFTEDFIPEFLINDLSDYTIITLTLDGEEYHIGDVIEEEGKHVLYIEVMDKAGNTSELSVEFILDKTAPKFLIDGVADGETYYDAISAQVSLDNPLDKINTVTVNGQAADGDVTEEFGQQIVKLNFNDIDDYEVMLKGTDEAGNTTVQKVNFTVAEKTLLSKVTTNKKLLYTSIAAVSAVLALGVTRILMKRRKLMSAAADAPVEIEE